MRRIDCYGNATESETFERHARPEPLETKQAGDRTYMRFTGGDPCAVHRLFVADSAIVEETWAWGRWEDAGTLRYVPLGDTLEVGE